jgi:hypothetical protein
MLRHKGGTDKAALNDEKLVDFLRLLRLERSNQLASTGLHSQEPYSHKIASYRCLTMVMGVLIMPT